MIRLLTGLPRPTGVGQYVSDLATIGIPCEIFFRRPMTPAEYADTTDRSPSLFRGTLDLLRLRRHPREAIDRTHVTWEGFGPVYGRRTRLLTVHHVLAGSTPWERWPGDRWKRALVFRSARRGYRRAVELGTRIVVPSEAVRNDLIRLYRADPARVTTIPHAIDSAQFRPEDRGAARRTLGVPGSGPILLHVGSDDGRKNIPGLLELFATYRRAHPEARLIQIGRSPEIERRIRSSSALGIIYRPSVSVAERVHWYNAAEVVVLPTFQEGFGYVAMEAMACGTSAVVSDLPVFREELGVRFRGAPTGRWDHWTRLIEQAIESPDASADREWVVRSFGRPAFVAAYHRLYRELGWD